MEAVLTALFTWQFIVFCIAVYAITIVIRRFAEYFMETHNISSKESKLWRDALLPSLPVIIGITFAIIAKQYPYPVDLHAWSGRAAWGLSGGLLSAWIYRVANAFLGSFISAKTPNADISDPNAIQENKTSNPNEKS